MANPVISSVTFDKSTYNVGDPITATVLYHDSNVHQRSTSGPLVVQHASATHVFSSGTSGTVAVTITAPATGNCLVACIGAVSATVSPSVTAVKTGTAAENWAQAKATVDPGILSTIWTDPGTTSSATTVNVTVSFGKTATASDQCAVEVDVFEVANAASFSVVDAVAASVAGNDSSDWSSGTSGITVQPNEIAFGTVMALPDAGGTATLTPPAAWTNEPVLTVSPVTFSSGAFSAYQVSGYQALTATGGVAYAGTVSADSFWQSCAVTLKAAAASTGTTSFSLRRLSYSGVISVSGAAVPMTDTAVTSDQVSAVSGVATSTHSFSPPDGSMVVVPIGYMFATNIGATLTVQDSAGNAYTVLQHPDAFGVGIAAIATCTYPTGPGAVTIVVTSTDTGAADCVISPRVIAGQALDQSRAASVTADAGDTYPPVATDIQGTLSTTVPSSLVYIATAGGLSTDLTEISGTTSISTWNDSGIGDFAGTGLATSATGTPGPVTLGWTVAPGSSFGFAALEVVPLTGVTGNSGFKLKRLSFSGTCRVVTGPFGALALRRLQYSGTILTGITSTGTFTLRRLGFLGSNATTFPADPIGILVELNVNGTWTDITPSVYMRDPVSISDVGRPNEGSSIQPGQCTLTLNNRTGDFSPKNTSGAYYPFIQRNAQLRVSVNSTTASGTAYAGYRFHGEVSEWPPTSDMTGSDAYAQITASGIWRRLSRATVNIGSAYTRYCSTLSSIAGYWPTEDGSGSLDLAPGVLGGASMIFTTGSPNLAATAAFPGSNAIPQLNGAVLTGTVDTSVSPGVNRFRFLVEIPAANDTGVAGGSVVASLFTSGTVARVDVSLGPAGGGPFVIQGFSSAGFQTFTAPSTSVRTFGVTILAEVSLVQSGSNINWALTLYLPGGTDVYGSASGSIAGTVSDATSFVFNPAGAYQNTAAGQAIVLYSSPPLADAAAALGGYAGETALDRFTRICSEEGIPSEVIGGSSVQMGPQFDGTLPAVLQTIETSDQGFLYESRDQFGLGYRAYNSMVNQVAAVTLDFTSGILAAVPAATYDDQRIVNDVVINNYDGYSYRLQLVTGAMSVLPPPSGVGDYPAQPLSTSLYATGEDVAVAQVAKRVLNPGVVDEVRLPNLTVNLAKTEAEAQFAVIAGLFVGGYVAISNPPSWLASSGPSKQLVVGYSETFSNFQWSIVFNTIPEAGYESAFNPGTTVGGRSAGNPVTGGQAGSVSGADIGLGAIGGGAFSTSLSASIGGITTSVGPTEPIDPAKGDLWINTLAGQQITRFDGVNWVGIVFDATDVIAAQSITAAQIQAETITASLLAAGIVIAGIVDATTITGASLIATGSAGEFLAYSGTPASGNLILSVSGTAGADGHGNSIKAGLWAYDTGGNSIGMVPGSNSAASQIALSTGNGTPTPPSGATALYGAGSGTVQVVDGADHQTYGTGRRSIVSGTGTISNTGVWQVIHSSNVAAPGSVPNRLYRVHGLIYMTASSSLANSFNVMWTGPGVSGLIDFRWYEGTSVWSIGGLAPNTRGTPTFTPSGGTTYVCAYDGAVTIPSGTSGAFEIRGTATSGESPWGVGANGFLDLMPV